jgi:D-arabinose 1-dehydrogenase-like Zn-dependent alcohol dehydrogenase
MSSTPASLRARSPSFPVTRQFGTIEAMGPRPAQRWGVEEGDRVAVEVFQSCRECESCLAGEYRRCVRHGLADMYGFLPVDREPGLWGGYAEYQYLAPDSMVLPVPDGLDAVVATLFNPLGAGITLGSNSSRHQSRRRRGCARPGMNNTATRLVTALVYHSAVGYKVPAQ